MNHPATAHTSSLFNRALDAARQTRHFRDDKTPSLFLYERSAAAITDKLRDVKRPFTRILEIGARGDILKNKLKALYPAAVYDALDASVFIDETLPLAPQSYDLIVSNLFMHHCNDVIGLMIQARLGLISDGLVVVSVFGGDTMFELKDVLAQTESTMMGGISPRISPMMDIRDAGGVMQRAGFALPAIDRDRFVVSYLDAYSLMKDLRMMGQTNPLTAQNKRIMPRDFFARVCNHYHETHPDTNNRIKASFDILYMMGWAPDASQPKPLKPGSGQVNLTQILGKND